MPSLLFPLRLLPFRAACAAVLMTAFPSAGLAADIVIVGAAVAEAIAEPLRELNASARRIDAAEIGALDFSTRPVLVLAPEKPLPPDSRGAIDENLRRGGRVIVIGPQAFDYSAKPANAVRLSRYTDEPNYRIVALRDDVTIGEPARLESGAGPDESPALGFRTNLRGMRDFRVEFDTAEVRDARRTVLQFWARGDTYMDVLAVEIRDTRQQRWLGFVPLSHEWRQHALSLADFLPEGWSDPEKPYPLLDPATVATVAFGPNRRVLWTEKPMSFSLGTLALAEDPRGLYTPTSALLPLRLPFLENGIHIPAWLFDPFAGAERAALSTGRMMADARELAAPPEATVCPVPFLELPGTRMGTDNRKDYRLKFDREMRREILIRTVSSEATPAEPVAELRLLPVGRYAGAAVALFGFTPQDLRAYPGLARFVAETVVEMAMRPRIAGAAINTSPANDGLGSSVVPVLKVVVQNPQERQARGRVSVVVADGSLRGEKPVLIPAAGMATVQVPLSAVPEDFPFAAFSWRVALETDAGRDELSDRVDVERALLHASRHLIRTQRQYPDGRFSNHYFGDAYGARAMLAYADLVRRDPARLNNHADLWRDTSPAEIEAAALRFFDMLVARQNDDGSVPMGYGEHRSSSNVADIGQMSLGVGQVASLLDDPARRERHLQFCRRFVDAAETFYIDEKLAAELSARFPDQAKKGETRAGHYGLGWSSQGRTETGPWWVLPDILGVQVLLTYFDSNPDYRRIYERNIRFFLDAGYGAVGYFHAEALAWVYLTTTDEALRERIVANLRAAFLPPLLKGEVNDMYDLGARTFLKGLPLLYFRRYVSDDAGLRAVQLKYVWAFASEDAPNAMRRVAEQHPKPIHGESLAAAKQAACGAIWAVELLEPGASLLRHPRFPAARR